MVSRLYHSKGISSGLKICFIILRKSTGTLESGAAKLQIGLLLKIFRFQDLYLKHFEFCFGGKPPEETFLKCCTCLSVILR